jgi:conjugative relaxase-like TrwC/TraI family protein
MLSIGKLAAGREDYYLASLAATGDEYYLDPTEIPGRWHGALAGRLGLAGTVDADAFRAVLDGCHPDGTGLVPGAGGKGRVTGFDLTFSAPKSVTLLWALSDADTAAAVVAAHDAAVADAFGALEAEAVFARRGHAGATTIPGRGLVAAGFGHRTSRAGDPQLHTHLVTANLTVGTDGRWSAPDGRAVYGWVKTTGYLYQAALRARLTETLGVTWTPVRKGVAEIEGITAAQRDRFSTRRAEITAELARLGYTTTRAARTATLTTRPAKDRTVGLDQLRHIWADQAAAVDLDITTLPAHPLELGDRLEPSEVELTDRLLAADGLTAQATSFDRRTILQALAAGHQDGALPDRLRADADRFVAHPDVIPLATTTPAGGPRHTTRGLLFVEAHLIGTALTPPDRPVGVAPPAILDRVLTDRPGLTSEQQAMVTRLVTSGAGVDVVVGRAGTGKTYALDAARAAWTAAGHRVIGTALAARAAIELQDGAGIPSGTIDRLLVDLDRPGPLSGLTPNTVVVVDEAGMVGTRKLDRLLTHTRAAGAKLVLVGDPRQLPEIDAGGALGHLARRLPAVELTGNRRQEQPWERAALDELRAGAVTTAVADYHRAGRITLTPTADTARQALVDDWWHATQTGPGVAAMYALGRADVADLNRRARAHLRASGRLTGPDITICGRDLAVGDHVLALRNDRRLGVTNGTVGTLTELSPDRAVITTTNGPVTLTGDYLTAGHLTHAYATTIHKAQGATVDHAFLLGSDHLYREAGYVGLSRARTSTRLYLVDPTTPTDRDRPDPIRDLAIALNDSRAQTLATDQHPHPDPPPAGPSTPGRPATGRAATGRSPADMSLTDRRAVLADPPPCVLDTLGPPHLLGPDRDRWADTATQITDYRTTWRLDRTGTPERPPAPDRTQLAGPEVAIGPEPDDRDQHRAWTSVRAAITHTRPHGLDREHDQGLSR